MTGVTGTGQRAHRGRATAALELLVTGTDHMLGGRSAAEHDGPEGPGRERPDRHAELDITRTNGAVERLLEITDNPRHRFMLQAYHRHRHLEIAGRYEEIFAPEMMVHMIASRMTGHRFKPGKVPAAAGMEDEPGVARPCSHEEGVTGGRSLS
ncbi:hypothetical protein [Streptomyces sp. MK5]|uniref:hypothetical protein n=1 Tax=Streptomyces sp. MK5 TaxID=3064253 RepID=UPI0027416847|nr:hypothetical protein [Streptomyces sp. MK5]